MPKISPEANRNWRLFVSSTDLRNNFNLWFRLYVLDVLEKRVLNPWRMSRNVFNVLAVTYTLRVKLHFLEFHLLPR